MGYLERKYMCNFWNMANDQVSCPNMVILEIGPYYTKSKGQICVRFTLWAIFEKQANLVKSALIDAKATSTCSRSEVLICILNASLRPSFLSYVEPFSNYGPILGKLTVHQMTWYFQGQKYPYVCYIHPLRPKFPWAISNSGPIWGKLTVHQMTWYFQGQKYPYVCYIHPLRPKFPWAISNYGPIWGKVHLITQKWPWYFHGQEYPYACYIHPQAQSFIRFTLRWTVFDLHSFWGKSAPNDFSSYAPFLGNVHQMTRHKYKYACYTDPPKPKFSSVSHCDQLFLSYGPILLKVHWMTPKRPCHVKD